MYRGRLARDRFFFPLGLVKYVGDAPAGVLLDTPWPARAASASKRMLFAARLLMLVRRELMAAGVLAQSRGYKAPAAQPAIHVRAGCAELSRKRSNVALDGL